MQDLIRNIIEEVKQNPIIWDKSHPAHNNRVLVDQHWDAIAARLCVRKDLVKSKWKSLRDNFGKELKKQSMYPNHERVWIHFKSLLFLTSMISTRNQRKRKAFVLDDSLDGSIHLEGSDDSLEPNFEPEYVDPLSDELRLAVEGRGQEENVVSVESAGTTESVVNTGDNSLGQLAYSNDNNDDESEDDLFFFKSLLPHLKLLPPVEKLSFRSKVQDVLAQELAKLKHNQ